MSPSKEKTSCPKPKAIPLPPGCRVLTEPPQHVPALYRSLSQSGAGTPTDSLQVPLLL